MNRGLRSRTGIRQKKLSVDTKEIKQTVHERGSKRKEKENGGEEKEGTRGQQLFHVQKNAA